VTRVRSAWGWLRARAPVLVDGLLGVALAIGSAAELLHDAPADAAKLPLILIPPLALTFRRRYPLPVWLVQVLASGLALRPPTLIGFVAVIIGVYTVGAHSRWRLRSLAVLAAAAVFLQVGIRQARPPLPDWSLNPLLIVGLWLAGNSLRGVRERAARIEREQELAARAAVGDERARIARELHDIVAHSVSVMVVQAGAARRLLGPEPGRPGEALLAVESGGREALAELRRMLGLLAGGGPDGVVDGQPGLGQLDALVERMRGAGMAVALRVEGARRPLPAGLDLAAYRVVQEALTNVLKHARGARADVVVQLLEREAAAGGRGLGRSGRARRRGRGARPAGHARAGERVRR